MCSLKSNGWHCPHHGEMAHLMGRRLSSLNHPLHPTTTILVYKSSPWPSTWKRNFIRLWPVTELPQYSSGRWTAENLQQGSTQDWVLYLANERAKRYGSPYSWYYKYQFRWCVERLTSTKEFKRKKAPSNLIVACCMTRALKFPVKWKSLGTILCEWYLRQRVKRKLLYTRSSKYYIISTRGQNNRLANPPSSIETFIACQNRRRIDLLAYFWGTRTLSCILQQRFKREQFNNNGTPYGGMEKGARGKNGTSRPRTTTLSHPLLFPSFFRFLIFCRIVSWNRNGNSCASSNTITIFDLQFSSETSNTDVGFNEKTVHNNKEIDCLIRTNNRAMI